MQAFPQMIFHVVEAPMVVKSKEELERYLKQGWSMTSIEFDQIKMVRAKMDYHHAEFERLAEVLADLEALVPEPEKASDPASCASSGGKKAVSASKKG